MEDGIGDKDRGVRSKKERASCKGEDSWSGSGTEEVGAGIERKRAAGKREEGWKIARNIDSAATPATSNSLANTAGKSSTTESCK